MVYLPGIRRQPHDARSPIARIFAGPLSVAEFKKVWVETHTRSRCAAWLAVAVRSYRNLTLTPKPLPPAGGAVERGVVELSFVIQGTKQSRIEDYVYLAARYWRIIMTSRARRHLTD